jgi:uncharacterized protein
MGVNSAVLHLGSGPVRTCIGCRRKCRKADLLRVVGSGTHVVPDPAGVLPGRGAYLHRDIACVDVAERKRAFSRALRNPALLDTSAVRETVGEEDRNRPAVLVEGAQDEHPMNGQP